MSHKYSDLRKHLTILEKEDLLYKIKRPINRNTELHPLVRWQFRGGLSEKDRKAFLFENVVDSKGKKFSMPVTVGAYAASKYIYAIGLGCEPEKIPSKWEQALSNPLEPVFVSEGKAPVHEVVKIGNELKTQGNGFDKFPVPISTPGFDCAPYITCSNWVTKDPNTGIQNIGNYRSQIKAQNILGVKIDSFQDGAFHWKRCKEKQLSLEAAVVIGPPPVIAFAAAHKAPRGVDEHTIAGGLAGIPINVVKCKTVDLFVPAEAEIVIEGIFSTEFMEPEAPFGESHGYMSPRELSYIFEATAITHRKEPIWVSWISQVTPSESSVIKRDAYNHSFLLYLKVDCRIPNINRVIMHEPLTNLRKTIIIQMKNPSQEEVWRALYAVIGREPGVGKIVIAVDGDIDPENMDAVIWAMSYRMKPHEDVDIVRHRVKGHGPPFTSNKQLERLPDDSALLINATLKEPFPPVSLPKREFMENAKKIWEELNLPKLKPESPWFGYSLGQWNDELDHDAQMALEDKHYLIGKKLAAMKEKV